MREIKDTIYNNMSFTQLKAAKEVLEALRIQIFKWKRPLIELQKLYKQIDAEVNEAGIPGSASCKKGCSFCCYINVDVSIMEASLLTPYVRKQDRELMDKQKNLSFIQFNELPYTDRKCIFLEDNKCRAYNDRPLACRTHFVGSLAQKCDTSGKDQETQILTNGIISLLRDSFHSVYKNDANIATQLLKL